MASSADGSHAAEAEPPPLSKNQLKKRKRDEKWEAGREARKEKRKLRNKAKKEANRLARTSEGNEHLPGAPSRTFTRSWTQLPVSLIIDCGFEDLMSNTEIKSLEAQLTRSYSENQKSPCKAHIGISSFQGQLKDRFDGVLNGNYRSWKGIRFLEKNIDEVAGEAIGWTEGARGGEMQGAFKSMEVEKQDANADGAKPDGEMVYLTSDSPDTLTELRPHHVYVIGGLVDRNRHKGVCYKKALELGIRTAKLPIGEYMKMNSRFVLAVNHVVEILLRWLTLGDWGKAFMEVMPKRKGGELKNGGRDEQSTEPQENSKDEGAEQQATEDAGEDSANAKQDSVAEEGSENGERQSECG